MLFSFEPISYSCEGKAQSTTLTESMVLSLWIPGGFVWDTHKEKTSWFPWERIPVRTTSSGSLALPSSHPRLSLFRSQALFPSSASVAYWFKLSTYLSLQKTLPHCISAKLIYRLKFLFFFFRLKFLIWENKTEQWLLTALELTTRPGPFGTVMKMQRLLCILETCGFAF